MVASRWALFCTFIPIGLTFFACGEAADSEVDPRGQAERQEWSGFEVSVIPNHQIHDWPRRYKNPQCFTLGSWEPSSTIRHLTQHLWRRDRLDKGIFIRVPIGDEFIWLSGSYGPSLFGPTVIVKGTSGDGPWEFVYDDSLGASDLEMINPYFEEEDWKPLTVNDLQSKDGGIAFVVAKGMSFQDAHSLMKLSAQAGVRSVQFYEFQVSEAPDWMLEEDNR